MLQESWIENIKSILTVINKMTRKITMKMMTNLTQYQLKTLLVNFFFVYESPDMRRLHCRYGDNLIFSFYFSLIFKLILITKLLLFFYARRNIWNFIASVTNNQRYYFLSIILYFKCTLKQRKYLYWSNTK